MPGVVKTGLQEVDRRLRKRVQDRLYHASHARKAATAYGQILAQFPEHALDAAQRRRIRDYSKEVLGETWYAPWLEVFAAFRGEFIEGWIPDNYFGRVLAPSWRTFPMIDRKTTSKKILGTDRLPDLAYQINGFWLDTNNESLAVADLERLLFAENSHVFVKRDGFSAGTGVRKIAREDFDPHALAAFGNLVVQAPIRHHPFFDDLSPTSLATLRVTTIKPPMGKAESRAMLLRIARKGPEIAREGDEILVGILDRTGKLNSFAVDDYWQVSHEHPDTGARYEGTIIPGFEDAVRFCEDLHDRNPYSGVVGWDLTLDPDLRPALIEWNTGHVGTKVAEASIGPCFRGLGWEDVWRKG
jgi:hypothetical protein